MSTIDTSTWNPDADFNVEIEGIPLNSDAGIAQTWKVIAILMAALKGDTNDIKLTINQPDGTTIVATNQTLTVVDNSHSHTIANVTGLQTALDGKAANAGMTGATASADGAFGLVPQPLAGDQDKVLKGDGTWGAGTDSNAVHKTGDETIAGTKTFSSTISGNVSGNAGTATKIQGSPTGSTWTAGAKAGGALVSSTASVYGAILNAPVKEYRVSLSTYPDRSNLVYLLSVSNANVEAGTNTVAKQMTWDAGTGTLTTAAFSGTVQTASDGRLKTTIAAIPDAVLDAWGDVQWGQFQFLDAVGRKGGAARLHLGLIAQRVQAAFEARGLDACAYGILCFDVKTEMWTVRYAEALAMEAACQRRRADRLEARIATLEEKLNG